MVPLFIILALSGPSALGTPPDSGAAPVARRNSLRLDLVQPAYALLLSSMGGAGAPLALRLGYERHLRGRFSLLTESLLGGPKYPGFCSALTLQARAYLPLWVAAPVLSGLYAGPTLTYKAMRVPAGSYGMEADPRRRFGSGGVVVGAQLPGRRHPQLIWDASVELGGWKRLNRVPAYNQLYQYRELSNYEKHGVAMEARLGCGWRF